VTDDENRNPTPVPPGGEVPLPVKLGAPNPQGKGLVGVLEDWRQSQPRAVVAKRPAQLLADYFTALLVLSSTFRFRPVRDKTYYLYFIDREWSLSLVSPDEWNDQGRTAAFVGACVLHEDATWSITPSDNLGRPGPVADALADAYRGFLARLEAGSAIEDSLPEYEGALPYYQRLFAAALGRSVRGSIRAGGQEDMAIEDWLDALPMHSAQLLERLDQGS